MFNLWVPQDNKFVTELEIKKSAAIKNLQALEARLRMVQDSRNALEQRLYVFGDNINTLCARSIKIVSMEEFRATKKALDYTHVEYVQASNTVLELERAVRIERNAILNIEEQIEAVRFRLLEFKSREEG